MRVLVAGASGYIGRHVTAELVARGHEVIALLRRTPAEDDPVVAFLAGARWRYCHDAARLADERAGGLTNASPLAADEPLDAVVSCIAAADGRSDTAWAIDYAGNRALLELARRHGARRFVLLSALCVQTPRLAFQRAKLAFEEILLEQREIRAAIVRPSAFYKSLVGQIPRVRAGKPFLLFGRGDGPACLPIGEADLAVYMADRLDATDEQSAIWPIGGPGAPVTPRERGDLLFALAGRRPRFRHLPLSLVRGVESVCQPLVSISRRAADTAEFARIAHFYATEPMLVRDPISGQPRAELTPRYGNETIDTFYRRVWEHGLAGQSLGEHALFGAD